MNAETCPPPAFCERLENMLSRHGGSQKIIRPAARLHYALPAAMSGEVRDFLQPLTAVELEPDFVARLPGGRVFGSGQVLAPDGGSIARDVSSDFGKPFESHWLLTYQKIRTPRFVAGTTAVVASTLGMGYSHWLLDELPRLLLLEPQASDAIIAHAGEVSFSRQALLLHGFSGKIIQARRDSHFACEHLIVPSLVGQDGRPAPAAVQLIETFAAPLLTSGAHSAERLYISRRSARRRRVSNETELWTQLAPRGFVTLHLEELTWEQQINAFRAAKVIVAPHGAGLANLVFCQPGTKVVEFFNRSYVNPLYWRLAALKGLDYRPVVTPGPEPLAETLGSNRLDITADIPQILEAV